MAAIDKGTRSSATAVEDMLSPCGSAAAVTPDNSTELTYVSRALFVGGAGALTCLMADGTTCTFTGVVAGSVLPIRVRRVNSTSTTATNIVAIW